MVLLRTGAFCLTLILFGVASAAWGQTIGASNVGGGKWFESAQQQLPIAIDKYRPWLEASAAAHNLQPELLVGVMMTETEGVAKVRDGLMQLTPIARKFLRMHGVSCNFTGAACEIEGAAVLLAWLNDQTGDMDLAIVAYNVGIAGVEKVDIATSKYLARVMSMIPAAKAIFHPEPAPDPQTVVANNDASTAQTSQQSSVDQAIQLDDSQK